MGSEFVGDTAGDGDTCSTVAEGDRMLSIVSVVAGNDVDSPEEGCVSPGMVEGDGFLGSVVVVCGAQAERQTIKQIKRYFKKGME